MAILRVRQLIEHTCICLAFRIYTVHVHVVTFSLYSSACDVRHASYYMEEAATASLIAWEFFRYVYGIATTWTSSCTFKLFIKLSVLMFYYSILSIYNQHYKDFTSNCMPAGSLVSKLSLYSTALQLIPYTHWAKSCRRRCMYSIKLWSNVA